jgi:uncharacterized membrane protein
MKDETKAKILEMNWWDFTKKILAMKATGQINLDQYKALIEYKQTNEKKIAQLPHIKPRDETEKHLADLFPGGTFI